jgi:hypothetical protein
MIDKLVEHLALDERLDRARATRIVVQILIVLAAFTDRSFAHTEDYKKFCTRIARRLVHHRRFLRSAGKSTMNHNDDTEL